ncbi:hypothetical protein ISS86_02730 [Candidatus Microgenomates bacterium]|nr:hypothetical protein [Candidatus Microgenomates bacterium]
MPVIFEAPKTSAKGRSSSGRKNKKELNHLARTNPLSAFLVEPSGIRFAAQEKREKIVLLLRRHPLTNLPWMAFLTVLLLVPPFLLPVFISLGIIPHLPSSLQLIAILFWYLGCFGFFLVNFLLWYFNVNIITDKRIVDIDFIYLLYKETTATRINQVEDVTYKMGGLICTIFNFGDVFVHTAGPEQNIEFLAVPKPDEVTKIIVEMMGRRK